MEVGVTLSVSEPVKGEYIPTVWDSAKICPLQDWCSVIVVDRNALQNKWAYICRIFSESSSIRRGLCKQAFAN